MATDRTQQLTVEILQALATRLDGLERDLSPKALAPAALRDLVQAQRATNQAVRNLQAAVEKLAAHLAATDAA